jgi:trimethylamine:corrinoid methyltransferase-like protein
MLLNEIVDEVDHFMKGIPLSEESPALDVIHNLGPRGDYLQETHTYGRVASVIGENHLRITRGFLTIDI